LADYREHNDEIRSGGAKLVAVSVDPPNRSEALRQQLSLPFPILCDTGKRLVQEWDIYNPREKRGIAKPAIFVIGPDRRVRYAAVDTVSTRVPASEIIRVLKTSAETHNAQRKLYIPRFADWLRAFRNSLRR
jgi:peroxiredoxin